MSELFPKRRSLQIACSIFSIKNVFILLITLLTFCCSPAFAYDARAFLWGLTGGDEHLGRLDVLVPFYGDDCTHLFYGDVQGEIDTESNWFTGLGVGYRARRQDRLLGGYLFLDRNFSDKHKAYYILSPGIESIGSCWDARVNGYVPVAHKRHTEQSIPIFRDTCGENLDCEDSVFIGHQQFQQIFKTVEEVGTGIDAEVGGHFGSHNNISIYGGVYYFHFSEISDIKGVETRAVIPIKPSIAFTIEASYDNEQHGAIVGGIRLQSGHLPHPCVLPEDHLYDPIVRNIGTVKSGLGTPVRRQTKFDHLNFIRDNIFFFSSTSGTAFSGIGSGTFENPLGPDQFTQLTVDGIANIVPGANLFFNTGTFVIEPTSPDAPNASIMLRTGQSIFGRTSDYKCSAVGEERPILLGEIELTAANNHLDSIILTNSVTTTTAAADIDLVALDIDGATNVSICNSEINALIELNGSSDINLFATAIQPNNSTVSIETSDINAIVEVTGNVANISTIGIGTHDAITQNNFFTISDTDILSSVNITGRPNLIMAVGIGNNAITASADFVNNVFIIDPSQIVVRSRSTVSPLISGALTAGIGLNVVNVASDFRENRFALSETSISVDSQVGPTGAVITGTGAILIATGIGVNLNLGDGDGSQFINNTFALNRSPISVHTSAIASSSTGQNFALVAGIGNNSFIGFDASFIGNTFSLVDSSINVLNEIQVLPGTFLNGFFVTGIGGNAVLNPAAVANFNGNTFNLLRGEIDVKTVLNGNNNEFNFATVIGGNQYLGTAAFGNISPNTFNISNMALNSEAEINGINEGFNYATGVGGNSDPGTGPIIFQNTDVNILNSTLGVTALINGSNLVGSENIAIGLIAGTGTTINFLSSQGLVQAIVNGPNGGLNDAIAFIENGGTVIGGENITAIAIP